MQFYGNYNGVFTPPDTETDKRWVRCVELYGCARSTQMQTPTQIPIGFCANLLVTESVLVLGSVNAPWE